MPKIQIDDIEFNSEDLDANGKAQLASLQFIAHEVDRMKKEVSVLNTAKNGYLKALKAELNKGSDDNG